MPQSCVRGLAITHSQQAPHPALRCHRAPPARSPSACFTPHRAVSRCEAAQSRPRRPGPPAVPWQLLTIHLQSAADGKVTLVHRVRLLASHVQPSCRRVTSALSEHDATPPAGPERVPWLLLSDFTRRPPGRLQSHLDAEWGCHLTRSLWQRRPDSVEGTSISRAEPGVPVLHVVSSSRESGVLCPCLLVPAGFSAPLLDAPAVAPAVSWAGLARDSGQSSGFAVVALSPAPDGPRPRDV